MFSLSVCHTQSSAAKCFWAPDNSSPRALRRYISIIQGPLFSCVCTESFTYARWVLSDPGCGVPWGQGSAPGVPDGVAPDGSGSAGQLPLCSPTTPEDPEVAFPLRLELKILRLLREPRPLGDRDGGRKEAAFPALLSPHKSFVIPLSPSFALILSLNLFPHDFFFDGKLFRTCKKKPWTHFTSLRTGTPMTWKTQMSFELTVNIIIKAECRVVVGRGPLSGLDQPLMPKHTHINTTLASSLPGPKKKKKKVGTHRHRANHPLRSVNTKFVVLN